ncbi:MAG: hypothetical protein R3B84_15760 [Zavarzinella sp.]
MKSFGTDAFARLIEQMQTHGGAEMGTLVTPIQTEDVYHNPNCVKVVCDESGRALYFSRSNRLFSTPRLCYIADSVRAHTNIIGGSMSEVKRIQFSTTINASAEVVWHHITTPESYEQWTSVFAEGSKFEGSWENGSKIRFLSPSGDGMISEIADSRTNEFISIRHLGFISNGVEDTTSEAVRSWAPAYENYTLQATLEGTGIVVDQDVSSEWEKHISEAWPKALNLLKGLCESSSVA